MTPLASVAMLEKLALLKIALCRATAWSGTSSACLRAMAFSFTDILDITVVPYGCVTPNLGCEHVSKRALKMRFRVRSRRWGTAAARCRRLRQDRLASVEVFTRA